jgi:molybdate transport system substrate-binding protein
MAAAQAAADEVVVMSSGAFTAPYLDAAPWFEKSSPHSLVSVFGASTGGAADSIPTRLARGEPADAIIVSAQALDALIAAGEIEPGSRVDLVLSPIGMAVRAGAPKPDIGSVDALVRTLREAESIAYSASVSGTYLATELFPRLGLADEIAKRAGASKASASAPSSRAATPRSASSRSASYCPSTASTTSAPCPTRCSA